MFGSTCRVGSMFVYCIGGGVGGMIEPGVLEEDVRPGGLDVPMPSAAASAGLVIGWALSARLSVQDRVRPMVYAEHVAGRAEHVAGREELQLRDVTLRRERTREIGVAGGLVVELAPAQIADL